MPQPYNYNLNLPDPTQVVMGGLQVGQAVNQIKAKQAADKQAALQNAQLQQDLATLSEDPTPAKVGQMMAKYPQLSEEFKRTYDVLDSEQQKSRLGQATEVYSALQAGEDLMARELLEEQAVAYENSGRVREAKTLRDMARLVELSPETAKTSTGLFLASTMGPEKFTETFTKLEANRRESGLEESTLTAAEAKAYKAAVDADFAESNAVADLQKKGWDVTKIQSDIDVAKENTRIAAINAQIKREQNELKRDELALKLEEMQRKRDEVVAEKSAEVESSRSNIDNMLNNMDRILQTPAGTLDDALGAWDGSWIGGAIDTFDQDVQDFKANLENLDAQAFLAQVPQMKGLGALSENEGKKLAAALQSFNRKQSKDQFLRNVREAQRIMLKARENLATKYGVPDSLPDRPDAAPAPLPDREPVYRQVIDTETGETFMQDVTYDVPDVVDISEFKVIGVE